MSDPSLLYIVLLGPPGVGKGTQGRLLSETFGVPQVGSGDLFRQHIHNGTKLGQIAQSYMNRGELVPDEITIQMVEERLTQPDAGRGAILDGFPRTIPQGEALEAAMARMGRRICCVPYINAAEDVLMARLTGRRVCKNCGATFHVVFNPPQVEGVCDVCGQRQLVQRADDSAETARNRLRVYWEMTAPLIDHYRAQGVLVDVDGGQSIDTVTEALMAAVRERARA